MEIDVATITQQLEASNKTFAALNAGLERLRPKPTNPLRVAGFTLTMVSFLGSMVWAVWALSWKLSERPTTEQLQQVIDSHAISDGHPSLSSEISDIKRTQTEQTLQIRTFQTETRKDLDDIKKAISP